MFKQILSGGDRNYAYIIGDEESREAALIDPSYSPAKIVAQAKEAGLKIKYIINTHSHSDHTNGNDIAKSETKAKIAAYKNTSNEIDIELSDGDVLKLGELELKIIHTPGHTDDCICILAGNKLCTGDTLFVGKIGGTDLGTNAKIQYDCLHNKLMTLPDEIEVYPGIITG